MRRDRSIAVGVAIVLECRLLREAAVVLAVNYGGR